MNMMNEDEILENIIKKEDRLRIKYSRLSKVLLLFAILAGIWVSLIYLAIVVWDKSYTWALFSLDIWLYLAIIGVVVFILINIVIYLHFNSVYKNRLEIQKPKPEYIDGKRVHVFTVPSGIEGGVFSKTYVKIDEHNILRLRSLMVPPEDLWVVQ